MQERNPIEVDNRVVLRPLGGCFFRNLYLYVTHMDGDMIDVVSENGVHLRYERQFLRKE